MKTFDIIAKKNKRKNLLRTVALSSLASLVLLVGGAKGLSELTSRQGRAAQRYHEVMAELAYPNVQYTSAHYEPASIFSGDFIADRIKDLAGITTHYSRYQAHYTLFGNRPEWFSVYTDQSGIAYSRKDHLKVPLFFNTNHNYSSLADDHFNNKSQDIPYLSEMSGQALELAVTFDKPYTIAEIAELMPDNLKVNWYWIGTETSFNTRLLTPDLQLGLSLTDQVPLSAEETAELEKATSIEAYAAAYDKAVAKRGELTPEKNINNAFSFFKSYAQEALDKGWLDNKSVGYETETWTPSQDMVAFLAKYPTGTEAKFAGIIVTGRAEDMTQLENQDWIFASSIGQSVQIQPYHTLDVE